MVRLRRVSCSGPGLTRRRRGKGFVYLDAAGQRVSDEATLARIAALVIPPAWDDVWICPVSTGHVQATGVDARGRRQYRYHDAWRIQRDLAKHDRILSFAERLPEARARIGADLALEGLPRERVLACAVRLIDLGFFRVGGEKYAEENESYGVATLLKEHVTVSRGEATFCFTGKSGKDWQTTIAEPDVVEVVTALKRRRGGGPELLAWKGDDGSWVDVRSGDVNAYLRDVTGGDGTAKDFRTWAATVLAAVGLAVSAESAHSPTARKRAAARVVREVADYLGNTPAVCRASYIDPRLFDHFESGRTIAGDLDRLGDGTGHGELAVQGDVEAAVLALLRDPADAPALSATA